MHKMVGLLLFALRDSTTRGVLLTMQGMGRGGVAR